MKLIIQAIFSVLACFSVINPLCAETVSQTTSGKKIESLSGDDWNVGLPRFAYAFSKMPYEEHRGGRSKQAGSYNFPVSTNMANVLMELEPGAIRELHWHAEAAEWAYVLSGQTVAPANGPLATLYLKAKY